MSKPPVPDKLIGDGVVVTVKFPLAGLYKNGQWQKLGLAFEWDHTAYPACFVLTDIKGNTLGERVANFQKCIHVKRSKLVEINGHDLRIVKSHNQGRRVLETEMYDTLERAKDLVLHRNYQEPGSDCLVMKFLNPPRPDGYLFGVQRMPFFGQSKSSRSLRPQTSNGRLQRLLSEPQLRPLGSSRFKKGSFGTSLRKKKKGAGEFKRVTRHGSVSFPGGKFGTDIRPCHRQVPMVHMATCATPSATGKQVLSTLKNSTQCSIGFSTREEWAVMMEGKGGRFQISDGSAPVSFSAFGKQVSSEKKSINGFGFGSSKRQLPPFKGFDKGMDSPGPVLMLRSTLGEGRLSFGCGARKTISTDTGLDSPGPVYSPIFLDAIGRNPEWGFSFGNTDRPLHPPSWTPGPGQYDAPVFFGPGVNRLVGPKVIAPRFGKNNCASKAERLGQTKFYYGSSSDNPVNHDFLWKARVKEEQFQANNSPLNRTE
eukprot:g8891.t1